MKISQFLAALTIPWLTPGTKACPSASWWRSSVTYVSGLDRFEVVGAKGFEPSASWSRTRVVKNT